jgi:hypothetical protein
LRDELDSIGFLDPQEEYYTGQSGEYFGNDLRVYVEDTYYDFFVPDVDYLLVELAEGVELIQNFRPSAPLVPYTPKHLILRIEAGDPFGTTNPIFWPSTLPSIGELWIDRDQEVIIIEGDLVIPIFEEFSREFKGHVFQDGDARYLIHVRPLLPHETPAFVERESPPNPQTDFVSPLNCEDNS